MIWAGAGLLLACVAILLTLVAKLRAVNFRAVEQGWVPIPFGNGLGRRLDALVIAGGLASFLWHFGLASVWPQVLRPGFVVLTALWCLGVLLPLCAYIIWPAGDGGYSHAMDWLLLGAVLALPAFILSCLLSRLAFDRRPR
ncbi:hypothetical protein [Paracoccus sp. TOH]|uniref:hypothetical protein n=1 Tax=Paracoccus sp. TOH TaxID=1263728 RepID=UPI0025B184B1|nr:hypothetical protein [Paracoccus sp. TOH]WJS84410.1 hypothetical protein NBE95_01120 [Paracoccus sp. TOH]